MASPINSSSSTSSLKQILIIQHSDRCGPAYLQTFAENHKIPFKIFNIYNETKENFPSLSTISPSLYSAIVALGGPQDSYNSHSTGLYPYLDYEKLFLLAAIQNNVPVLGICLGGQILADCVHIDGELRKNSKDPNEIIDFSSISSIDSIESKVYLAPEFEVGYKELIPTKEGLQDPVVSKLFKSDPLNPTNPLISLPYLNHHQDSFHLPDSIPVLARSSRYIQCFRFKNIGLGVQFHPEATLNEFRSWTDWDEDSRFESVNTTRSEVLSEAKDMAQRAEEAAEIFFQSWWDNVLAHINSTNNNSQ